MKTKVKANFVTYERNFSWPAGPEWRRPLIRNTLLVSVVSYPRPIDPEKGLIKVAAYDLCLASLEKCYEVPLADYAKTLEVIDAWIKTLPNPLTQDWLLEQGFHWD